MLLTVVVPTFNRGPLLRETLASLVGALDGIEAEIFVVNDSKTQRVPPLVGAKLFDNPGSGAASARNYGARHASGKLLLFVDDDILVSRENVERVLALHRAKPGSCFNLNWRYPPELMTALASSSIGRFIIHVGQTEYRGWAPELDWGAGTLFETHRLATFFFSIERGLFERMGGFDEVFKNQGMEDEEFSARLRRAGVKMYIDPESAVCHNETDRVDLRGRLARFKNGACNKRQAVEKGLSEFSVTIPAHKRMAYAALSPLKPLLLFLAESLPNSTAFDPFYRRLAFLLMGTVLFEGYHRSERA